MEPRGRGSQPHLHVPRGRQTWVSSPQPRWDRQSEERLEAGCLCGGVSVQDDLERTMPNGCFCWLEKWCDACEHRSAHLSCLCFLMQD